MIEVIRSIVRHELNAVRGPALGVITALKPHASEQDDFNDEVDVTLQHEQLKLSRVPVAVAHPGTAAPLKVGDLVLVQFLGGDIQQPLVTACFHTADDRPPVHPEGERIVEQRVDGAAVNRLRWEPDGTVRFERLDSSGGAVVTFVLDKDGKSELNADGKSVTITCDLLTVKGDLTVDGGNLELTDGTVTTKHGSNGATTIDGHTITGS
jgi:uncharacterized protein involved in type VI secretion and phage assembly